MSEYILADDSHIIKPTKFVCSKCHKSTEQLFITSVGKYQFCEKCHSGFWEFIAEVWINE